MLTEREQYAELLRCISTRGWYPAAGNYPNKLPIFNRDKSEYYIPHATLRHEVYSAWCQRWQCLVGHYYANNYAPDCLIQRIYFNSDGVSVEYSDFIDGVIISSRGMENHTLWIQLRVIEHEQRKTEAQTALLGVLEMRSSVYRMSRHDLHERSCWSLVFAFV